MGEVHYCHPLYDPDGALRSLKNTTENYPSHLKRALIRNQLWEAIFALDTCRKSATRNDAFYVAGSLFRCAACMVQALFALNERCLEAVMNSITNGLGMRKTGNRRGSGQLKNPHFNAFFTQVHNTL